MTSDIHFYSLFLRMRVFMNLPKKSKCSIDYYCYADFGCFHISFTFTTAFESCTKGLLLARDLNRDSWTLGMEGRLRHVLQQTGMEGGNIKQWTPRVDDNPIGAGSDTHNQNLLTIDQLLQNLLNY